MNAATDRPVHTQRQLDLPATESELQHAYRRAGLKQHGIDFETATTDPAIRIALTNLARAMAKSAPRFKWGRR